MSEAANELGPISKHLEAELRELARQHGIVVWLDKGNLYSSFANGLKARADAGQFSFPVRCFRGSFLELMLGLDGLADGIGQKPLIVHVPGFTEDEIARTPLLELYRAGRRERVGLPKLVKEAAYGRCTVAQLEAFLAREPLTLEGADVWLAGLNGTPGEDGPDLSALGAEALVDALVEGGTLAERARLPEVQRAVWRRAELLLGVSPEARERFGEHRKSIPPGVETDRSLASDLLLELVGWTLAVEFVHDLKRTPRTAWLVPLTKLPAPVVETCRKLAKHLRIRYPEGYARWADEVEVRMHEELQATSAEDLGNVDTFRFEDQKILAAALDALQKQDYAAAYQWAVARGAGKSFWTQPSERARFLGWGLVESAATLGREVQKHAALLKGVSTHGEAVERYAEKGFAVDSAHRRLEQAREQASVLDIDEFPVLRQCLDQMRHVYRAWADTQALAFNSLCRQQGFLPSAALQQRTLFEDVVRPWAQEKGTTAYFMVDALRFELAEQLAASLKTRAATVSLKARLSELPSVTEVGMNVLAPLAQNGKLRIEFSKKSEIQGFRGGQARVSTPEDRRKAIHERVGGNTCPLLSLEEVLSRDVTTLCKTVAAAKVLIVHCEGIDKAGEKGVGLLVFEQELRKIAAAWHLLLQAGVLHCVITADHGFLLHDATTRAPITHGFKTDPCRRHVVSLEHLERPQEVAVSTMDLGYETDDKAWFLFPESAAPFDLGNRAKDFVHGGNSLQERVIPVLTVQHKHPAGTVMDSYRIEARAKESSGPTSRAHSLSLSVVTQGQTGLAFSAAKDIELVLVCEDDPEVQLQLTGVVGARQEGNVLIATVERPFEVSFRLTGRQPNRVRVRVRHATGGLTVEPLVPVERFSVDQLIAPKLDEPKATAAVGVVTTVVVDSWLLEYSEPGVRDVFRHLAVHGSVNEAEATRMLGGARQFRNFSMRFDEYAKLAPFAAHTATVSGTKCYVRGER